MQKNLKRENCAVQQKAYHCEAVKGTHGTHLVGCRAQEDKSNAHPGYGEKKKTKKTFLMSDSSNKDSK